MAHLGDACCLNGSMALEPFQCQQAQILLFGSFFLRKARWCCVKMLRKYLYNDCSPPSTSEGGHDSQRSGDVLPLRAFELERVTWILSRKENGGACRRSIYCAWQAVGRISSTVLLRYYDTGEQLYHTMQYTRTWKLHGNPALVYRLEIDINRIDAHYNKASTWYAR